jgi:hypothetical protein
MLDMEKMFKLVISFKQDNYFVKNYWVKTQSKEAPK